MGVGKSTVGHAVAEALRFEFLDTDALIESRIGKTIAQIFEQDGESVFRALEKQIAGELAACDRAVISCGGGFAANQDNINSLKSHSLVVCLWASADKI